MVRGERRSLVLLPVHEELYTLTLVPPKGVVYLALRVVVSGRGVVAAEETHLTPPLGEFASTAAAVAVADAEGG